MDVDFYDYGSNVALVFGGHVVKHKLAWLMRSGVSCHGGGVCLGLADISMRYDLPRIIEIDGFINAVSRIPKASR